MASSARILVIDRDVTALEALRVGLSNNGLQVEAHADAREALEAFAAKQFDAVIADIRIPRRGGQGVLARLREHDPTVPVILLARPESMQRVLEAVSRGVFDCVAKPASVAKVRAVVDRALEVRRLQAEVTRLRAAAHAGGGADELIAQSPAMAPVVETIRRAAAIDACVLVTGSRGTGREQVARVIHRLSAHAAGPFIAADCALLGDGGAESELFGHARGAFAGAVDDRRGLFELADGGTLFLDAIDELSKAAQRRLLTMLETREVRPLGGTAARAVDVRLVAATSTDLAAAVAAQRFRADLHERLGAVRVALPELHERCEDIPLLAHYFAKQMSGRLGLEPPTISPEAMRELLADPWPGNVRQLRETIERATLLADAGVIQPEHFLNPATVGDASPAEPTKPAPSAAAS